MRDASRPSAPEPRAGPVRRFSFWVLILAGLSVLARLPLIGDPATVTPDGAEYLAIARSIRTTGAYATDLKWQFYTDDPVRHSALGDRPPVYPLFAVLCALVLPFADPVLAARLGNVLLTAAAVILGALYLRRLYGDRTALLATGFTFFLPHTLYWTAQPLTEALLLCLSLGALLLWARARPPSPDWDEAGSEGEPARGPQFAALGAGLLAGVAYLTRPTGGFLIAVFLLDSLSWRRGRGPAAWAALGFVLLAAPYHLALWRTYGSPFHSALGYTFAVETVHDVTVHGFGRPHPTPAEFLSQHWREVPHLVLGQARSHADGLLLPLLGLLPFALRLRPDDWSGARRPAFLLVGITLAAHTLAWSAKGSSRYFLLCLLILAAALLSAAERLLSPGSPVGPGWWRRAALWLPAASLVGLIVATGRFYSGQAGPDRGVRSLSAWREAAATARGRRLVASDNPWMLNLLAERPAVMLPRTGDSELLGAFLRQYRPEALVLVADEPAEAPMAAGWRAGRLPAGWRLARDDGLLLVATGPL